MSESQGGSSCPSRRRGWRTDPVVVMSPSRPEGACDEMGGCVVRLSGKTRSRVEAPEMVT